MISETVTYQDHFTKEEVTETWWFHVSRADAAELVLGGKGDVASYLQSIIDSGDGEAVIKYFKKLLRMSVGKQVGRHFVRSETGGDDFMFTPAYDEIFMRLVTNAEYAAAFCNGLMEELVRSMQTDAPPKAKKVYSSKELLEMPQEEFDEVVGTDIHEMSREHFLIASQRKWGAQGTAA